MTRPPPTWADGLRLAVTVFTVAPIAAPSRFDRPVAAWSMRFAAPVGALLGLAVGAVMVLARWLGTSPLLAAVLAVGAAALLTRGLHLDGLADTADGLGAYRGRERALQIMKSPEVGPFGVVVLVMVLLVQVAALAQIAVRPWWPLLATLMTALATARIAIMFGCLRGTAAARPDGLGAMVAGTVSPREVTLAGVATAMLSLWSVPGRPWQGPVAVAAALAVALLLRRHAVRRLGGVTGDVFGLLAEASFSVALIVLSLRSGPAL